ncbi:DNA-processing protein DprA [Pseudomonas sp. RIT-PI-S]|uniref:DNA-processing protein DprA n=1 Tax=Pseudomonas sp. RIT-PI-S TaxID=3035295 RepID=UPI0021DAD87D|nr:DNA-processing protein DprA [Pseudomonas sp. RIT-PI-S]
MDLRDFWRNERVAFLGLCLVKGVGFWSLRKIATEGRGFKEVLRAPSELGIQKHLDAAGYRGDSGQEELWSAGLALARILTGEGIRLIFKDEPEFPSKLRSIHDAPEWIFIQGSQENLQTPSVAIVGTRKPSDDGLFLTRYILAALAGLPCSTVSGLAVGIDQAAHAESIRYKLPTIAVLGTGILQDYPKGSELMRTEILRAGGTIISEYLPSQSYSAENFVRRNRLQAALCDVLVPTQWDIKSGTAHTVRFAFKYGKSIVNLCLPGTKASRPEIAYAWAEYNAKVYEVPVRTSDLIDYLKDRLALPNFPVAEKTSSSPLSLENESVKNSNLSGEGSVKQTDPDAFGQLSLI